MAAGFEFISWERCTELCFQLYEKIKDSEFIPDVIIGIARGGWVPARILSDFFFTYDTANVKVDLYRGIYARADHPQVSQALPVEQNWQNPLVVDDISDSGDSLIVALDHLKIRGYPNFRTATLHIKPWTKLVPDYYVHKTKAWVVYPWELKEFSYNLANKLSKKQVKQKEIRAHLLKIGLPKRYVDIFFNQWLKKDSD